MRFDKDELMNKNEYKESIDEDEFEGINLKEEYELILQKKSNLSANKRDKIICMFNKDESDGK